MILKVIRLDGFLWTVPRTRTSCVLLSAGFHEVTILSYLSTKYQFLWNDSWFMELVKQNELFLYLTEVENSRLLLSF